MRIFYYFYYFCLALIEQQISAACATLAKGYKGDISQDELGDELPHLESIHATNIGEESLYPHSFLNQNQAR